MTAKDLSRLQGFTITSVARTLIDLGAVVGEELVEIALDDALSRRLTSVASLKQRLDDVGARGRRGVAVIKRLLIPRRDAEATKSLVETKLLRVIREGRLPEPKRQFEVLLPNGHRAAIDLAYPGSMLAIDAEGFRFHGGRQAFQHDATRRNNLILLGWTVPTFTWDDVVNRPEYVVATIRRFLSAAATNKVAGRNKNIKSLLQRTHRPEIGRC